ncbi:hypothetical protein DTO207G8_2429 [Paecilomyces variotii]|nr:hypothetical protein DTO207G8_2429 [Paecilomyces variotii]KAJ9351820.1 hypothetical protein DTO027B9_6196 [Paecilomyces variotii]
MDPPSPLDSPLISPSKARQAAIQAKDWAYINSWLARQYAPNPVPPFERNEDTLKTLLALAAANDTADEEAALFHRAREEALQGLKAREKAEPPQKKEILDEIEDYLDEKGAKSLDDLAATTVALGTLGAEDVTHAIIELTTEEFDAAEQVRRVEDLQNYLEKELDSLRRQLEELKTNEAYETPPDILAQSAEWNRGTKILGTKAGEYQSRIASLERTVNARGPTIQQLMEEEQCVLRLKETVSTLEGRLKAFHCLPPDVDGAKLEYKRLERELNQLIRRRDRMFEGLVEG